MYLVYIAAHRSYIGVTLCRNRTRDKEEYARNNLTEGNIFYMLKYNILNSN